MSHKKSHSLAPTSSQPRRKVILSPSQDYGAEKANALAASVATFLGILPDEVLLLPAGASVLVIDTDSVPIAAPVNPEEEK